MKKVQEKLLSRSISSSKMRRLAGSRNFISRNIYVGLFSIWNNLRKMHFDAFLYLLLCATIPR